jgi:hypothetical protein
MRTSQLRAVLLATALPIALAGCAGAVSTGSFKGEAHQVAERIASFQKDAGEGDQRKVCADDLAATLREGIARFGRSCEEAVKEQLKAVEEIAMTVKAVQVSGTRARAKVESAYWGKACTNELYLVKEGSQWRISGIGPGCPRS